MGASLGAGDSRHNVELNIIPMIDLMSCLTAFLLVAAAWVNTAQLQISPAGRGGEGSATAPRIGVLVQADRMWLTVSEVGDIVEIPDVAGEHNWTALSLAFADLSRRPELSSQRGGAQGIDVSVAAESTAAQPVLYQELITAVDVAMDAGFKQVGITDVHGLALSPVR